MAPRGWRLAYRIEDQFGWGPWRSPRANLHDLRAWGVSFDDHPSRMPELVNDTHHYGEKVERTNSAYRFGFPSVATLRYWFNSAALAYCDAFDYACTVYVSPPQDHTMYEEQIHFRLATAKKLRTIPLVRLMGVPCL